MNRGARVAPIIIAILIKLIMDSAREGEGERARPLISFILYYQTAHDVCLKVKDPKGASRYDVRIGGWEVMEKRT